MPTNAWASRAPDFASVILEESHDIPNVDLSVVLLSGSAADPAGKWGLSRFTAEMLLRGTKTRDNVKLAVELDQLGSELSVAPGTDSLSLSGETLTRNLDAFLTIVADVVTNPAFDLKEFDKLKALTLDQLKQANEDDQGLARRKMREFADAGHPYGHDSRGTVATVSTFTLDDVKKFYEKHWVAGNIVIGAGGDLDKKELGIALGVHFAAVRPGPRTGPVSFQDPPRPKGRQFLLVDKPERNQAQIYFALPGIPAKHSDAFSLMLANEVLGGGRFSTVLMREVRVKRGLSYGAYSFLTRRHGADMIGVWVFPESKKVIETLELIFKLSSDHATTGFAQADFDDAKSYLVKKYPFLIDTAQKRMSQRLEVYTLGLPDDYVSTYRANLERVTREDAMKAAKKYFTPDNVFIAIVCTASGLKDAVAKLPGVTSVEVKAFDQDPAL